MDKVKLIIKDEINCKFENLPVEMRRALMKRYEFMDPSARYTTSFKLRRWNGKINYFTIGGSTFIHLLEDILTFLDDKGYDIELNDLRDNTQSFVFDKITQESFSETTWPEGHEMAGEPIVLRDYQVEIINNFLANPQSLQEVATGAGKTLITAALSKKVEQYGRSIVIVPNKSLVNQTEADYINLGLDVGVYFGDRKEYNKTHTICTWQSLNNLLKNTKAHTAEVSFGEFVEGVVCVIVDEVHSAKSNVLKSLLTREFANMPIRWGLTGTVPKEDFNRLSLVVSLGPVIGKLSASELQDKGVLAKCNVNIIQTVDDHSSRDYASELKFLTEHKPRLQVIADLVSEVSNNGNTLILVGRISTGQSLLELLKDRGKEASFVSGSTKMETRKEQYDEIKSSYNKIILATYGVAAVGINIPRIFNLVLIEPGKSFVRVIQSIGRGIRKAKDKEHVEIWDLTSTCKFSKRHLTQRKAFYREANYPFNITKTRY